MGDKVNGVRVHSGAAEVENAIRCSEIVIISKLLHSIYYFAFLAVRGWRYLATPVRFSSASQSKFPRVFARQCLHSYHRS